MVLDFRLEDGAQPVECILHLANNGTERVAFKVKTTKPKRYLVRPNQGTIEPSTKLPVSIVLLAQEKMELLQEYKQSGGPREINKFMVQALPWEDGATGVSGTLPSDVWEAAKERVQQKKLVVSFSFPHTAGSAANMANLKQASNAIRDVVSGERLRFRSRESSGEEGSRGEGAGAEGSEISHEKMWARATALRQKYDDLVSFTINLTAEKDLIQRSLTSTKDDLLREQQARKQLETQMMEPGARRSARVVGTTAAAESRSGFSLFFVLLVAIMALFAGQYAAANGIADVFGGK